MKLAEHKKIRKEITCSCCEGTGVIEGNGRFGLSTTCSECRGSGALLLDEMICDTDCGLCYQLSLLQQIVDDLKAKKNDLDFYCQSGVAIVQARYLKTLIEEYEAIIEGAK